MGGWAKVSGRSISLVSLIAGITLLASAAAAQTPSLTLIGVPTGRVSSELVGISADGTTAVGAALGNDSAYRGLSWTRLGGLNEWGSAPGVATNTRSAGVSANGSVIVGTRNLNLAGSQAFRFSQGTYSTLGPLPPGFTTSGAAGVSGDGSLIVGAIGRTGTSEAMRWTALTGVVSAGLARPSDFFSGFTGVSRDGSTAIGISTPDFNGNEAYSWTQAGGWRHLPVPASIGPNYSATPTAANFDGTMITGLVTGVGFPSVALLWRNGTPTILESFGPQWSMSPGSMSDDGTVIIGAARPSNVDPYTAVVWLNGGGPTRLEDYLASFGVTVPAGFELRSCAGISDDGRTFVGVAEGPTGSQGYVAVIPSPGVGVLGMSIALAASRRRQVSATVVV